jgi:hypothetical protein
VEQSVMKICRLIPHSILYIAGLLPQRIEEFVACGLAESRMELKNSAFKKNFSKNPTTLNDSKVTI